MNRQAKLAAVLFCIGLLAVPGLAGQAASQEVKYEDMTPSHVYQVTSDLISEIEILRDAMGVTVYPIEAELQEDRAPVHVYSKSLEVMEKISAAQRRLGIDPAKVGQIPVKSINPGDVYRSVQTSLAEVRRIKEQLVIEDQIQPAPLEGGKTPTYVYKHLGDASYLLDGLVGHPVDPNDVYNHIVFLHDEMELIATKLKVALDLDPPAIDQRKRMKEVAQQVLRATFKIINLQTRLGMDASGVPQITLVRVSPAEVYEATNVLLAEMVRIKAHLDIPLPRQEHALSRNKRPRDVFSQVLLLIRNLDILAKAADNYQSA